MPLSITRERVRSIDVLRGLVMIIMALDHVRDFFHSEAMLQDPLNPATTTSLLYFTRWVTHFCAPLFVLLSGTSAYLAGRRKTKSEQSLFLIKRGLWLILMEVTLVTFGITFDPEFNFLILQVIWAIGISMVMLGLLVWLPLWAIFMIGLAIVFGHNLADAAEAARNNQVGFVWSLLHRQAFYQLGSGYSLLILYPFLPWTGIMLLGYCMGKWFEPQVTSSARQKRLLMLGSGLIVLFVVLRSMNGYGNPIPWVKYENGLDNFLSFLNVQKYPPSLMFSSIIFGIGFLVLALFENIKNRFTDVLNIYGRVPFFYYILHFYFIHILCVIAFYVCGYGAEDIRPANNFLLFRPTNFGFPLWAVYLIWLFVVAALYPLCRWYNRYKSTHKQWWLSYI